MNLVWRFRLLVLFIVLSAGSISIANLVAEFLRPTPLLSISGITKMLPQSAIDAANLVSTIMPLRSDLRAEYGLALAGRTSNSSHAPQAEPAKNAIISSLNIGPHDSLMWLVLALLQARSGPADPHVTESLKMSYLTGQNRIDLISIRLASATSGNSLSDPDLVDLARGDVRALLSQSTDQRQALVDAFAHASPTGKAFLERSVETVDPKFAELLRK